VYQGTFESPGLERLFENAHTQGENGLLYLMLINNASHQDDSEAVVQVEVGYDLIVLALRMNYIL